MERIEGDNRVFALINTTDYNNDGRWQIATASFNELPGLGVSDDDMEERIDDLNVGGVLNDFDYQGVILIRIA